ncbi:hypothetical protein H0H92_000206 [Tricholoma furcatifolium]|nr:hypothetical protein H0H92_000206 [Tricholoma furcatifolium]
MDELVISNDDKEMAHDLRNDDQEPRWGLRDFIKELIVEMGSSLTSPTASVRVVGVKVREIYELSLPDSVTTVDFSLDGPLLFAWSSYIDDICREWAILATYALAFTGSSAALLQMPGAQDPFTRSLIYLAVLRAIETIVYALVLLIYMRRKQIGSVQFVTTWVKSHQGSSNPDMPRLIFALPAVALAWYGHVTMPRLYVTNFE